MDDFIFPIFIYENESAYKNSLSLGYLNDSKVFFRDLPLFIQKLVDLKIYNILVFGIPKIGTVLERLLSLKRGLYKNLLKL
jgi:porphobilinogen synthase